jgi:prevent-host-death family protein
MDVSVKELRAQPGRILSMVKAGDEVTITMRGKPTAKIIPIIDTPAESEDDMFIGFGIWKNREDMEDTAAYVADMRKGRSI